MDKFPGTVHFRLPQMGTSIFAVMSQHAQEHGAINLAQGFPDFDISERLISLVNHYMKKGFNQYAPMPGVLILRERIAAKAKEAYGVDYDPQSEITITAGATQALFTAIAALIREDDEVIIFEPAYDSYAPAISPTSGSTGTRCTRLSLTTPG